MLRRHLRRVAVVLSLVGAGFAASASAQSPHNVVLFIPDGLRAAIVDTETTPTFARLRDEGVNFTNSHSLFPTFTTANASALATGHFLGDTGNFSNFVSTGFPVAALGGTVTPFLETNPVLREVSAHFHGNYLNEQSIVAAARVRQYSTAVIGKLGPAGIFDLSSLHEEPGKPRTLIVDDSTGRPVGVPLPQGWPDAIKAAGLQPEPPPRGDNANAGNSKTPGTRTPNSVQQQYFVDLAVKVILPRFKAANRPFVLVYWSRDPDSSQHNHGDSLGSLTPGINGATSMAAIRSADSALAAIEQALKSLGLTDTTNIVVAADHGVATISKASKTSPAAKIAYEDVNAGELPLGFLAIDIATALQKEDSKIRLFDPDAKNLPLDWKSGRHPRSGNGLIGRSAAAPDVVVAGNGGSDLIYLPGQSKRRDTRLARKVVAALLEQDYVSGLFVDTKRFGEIPGALSIRDIGLEGSAVTPVPAIVVNFASFGTGCEQPLRCTAMVADTSLQTGQGMHGSFSRAETWNFMAARGPDFRSRYVNTLPASNADVGMTIAHLLRLDIPANGKLVGRVLYEGLAQSASSAPVAASARTLTSKPAANGLKTVLKTQSVGSTHYFDAAGFPGRTVGLEAP
jgi:type I phosphodiesterase/nucleotide pyrophosphatase